MKKHVMVMLSVVVFTAGSVASAAVYENFEDGDYTNNPAWWVDLDMGADEISNDPVRQDNLVWKAYATETGHRVLKTNVSGIPWDTFDVSLEYMASTSGNFHGIWKLETEGAIDGITFGLWYDPKKSPGFSDYAHLWIHDYGLTEYLWTYTLIPIGNIPRDQWLKLHSWYDVSAELVRVEARILETDVLLGQVSRQSVLDLSEMGEVDVLGIDIGETNWQYMDNINLTPEPATLALLLLGGLALLRGRRRFRPLCSA